LTWINLLYRSVSIVYCVQKVEICFQRDESHSQRSESREPSIWAVNFSDAQIILINHISLPVVVILAWPIVWASVNHVNLCLRMDIPNKMVYNSVNIGVMNIKLNLLNPSDIVIWFNLLDSFMSIVYGVKKIKFSCSAKKNIVHAKEK
jgi:hypothetical protein